MGTLPPVEATLKAIVAALAEQQAELSDLLSGLVDKSIPRITKCGCWWRDRT